MRRVRSHKLFEWSMNPLLPLTSITLTAKTTSCSFSGDFELLATDFASSLGADLSAYMQKRHSLPAFLSAVTLRLFANRLEETLQGLATPPTLQ